MILRECNVCHETHPETTEFFYQNGKQPSGKIKWKPDCKKCHTQSRVERFDKLMTEVFGEIKCQACGYDSCKRAIDCHHLNEEDKDFEPAKLRSSFISLDKMRKELEKCVLLCSNCHREVHAGYRTL